MFPLYLVGATVVGACLVFGYSSFVVGLALMAVGVLGLLMFLSTPGMVRRPGESGTVIEERHYLGTGEKDDRRHHHR
ncbi:MULTISPECIES: hypothetical protein [unclassified Streptomyces]|uniref:hypothetical protein n=1 Tax=unclassified Streptomyces TaxID=2593676 RepID=UPI0013B5EB4D|nr:MULTISPECIES: hypothetical protein [unclassified Streptomyces]MCX4913168.1 hypothetical protein [Streptomyces sp. NBC_00687]NEB33793.1 hypothetical protein [Streptomyces sp. SID14446]